MSVPYARIKERKRGHINNENMDVDSHMVTNLISECMM